MALSACLAGACTGKHAPGGEETAARERTNPASAATTAGDAADAAAGGLYRLTADTLEGAAEPLSRYAGKVALVVNVASECGYTPQYQGLQKLYETYASRGFVVLGFPSNDFGEQEPGDPAQIRHFCSTTFHVTFPMFAKVRTAAPDPSPVYAFLGRTQGLPQWNFHKYLVGKDGQVLAAFPSAVTPESAALTRAIERALGG